MRILSIFVTVTFSLFTVLSAFAYNRTEYKKTSKRYYMTAKGDDKLPAGGSERAYAFAKLDLDYVGEDGKNHNRMDLFGYSRVSANGSGGNYSISASAYMTYKSKSNTWRWFIYKSIDADVRLNYAVNVFNVKNAYAKDYFYMVGANAQLTNSQNDKVEGHARDFSHGEPDKWICLDEEGNRNHGEDQTCVICDTAITD